MAKNEFDNVAKLRHNERVEGRKRHMTKIKQKRTELGYKQYKIAEYLRISTRHYARIENEERMPNDRELSVLAKLFDCSKKELED